MGKKPTINTELPTDEVQSEVQSEVQIAPAAAVTEIVIAMHLDPSPVTDYASRHLDCHLDRNQAIVLRQIQKAMDVRGERLNNGKRVVTKIDTLRRVLEVIGESGK